MAVVDTGRMRCPFCKGTFRANADAGTVEHSLPACERFDALDALDFVVAARRALGIPAAEEDAN